MLIDRTQFEATYRLVTLFFADRSRARLIGDPRWFYIGQTGTASVVARLLAGPSLDLVGATTSAIPAQTEVGEVARREAGGVRIDLRRAGTPNAADRALMAAQLVWTLNSVDAPAPYEITLDGRRCYRTAPRG